MEGDISKALTYQVKREIAEKYFGYRKIIEEDKRNLDAMLKDLRRLYEERIATDFLRIYTLLGDKKLAGEFIGIIAWPRGEIPFYDDHVVGSKAIRQRLLKEIEPHGWTSRGRFVSLFLASYERLLEDLEAYKEKYEECQDEAMTINEEIRQFRDRFALDEILGFIANLDRDDLAATLGENLPVGHVQELSERLRIEPIDLARSLPPEPPDLPPLREIRGRLKSLAGKAARGVESR